MPPISKPKPPPAASSTTRSSPPPPPPPSTASTDATERAFFARRSRVLRVSGLQPDQANQQDLRTWFTGRLGLGPDETVGIVGVCTHLPPRSSSSSVGGDTDPVALGSSGPSPVDWWAIFKEHELAHDAHRKVNASLPTSPAEAVTVGLALEEELAPLDRLVPMPLVRTLRLERQQSFPSASGPLSPDDDHRASLRATHARTPSLSFSSTSSAFSTHAQGSPASQTAPDLGPSSARTRTSSTLSLKTQFDVGAKPFYPADRSPSTSFASGGADEGADRDDIHRRPSLQGTYGLGYSMTGETGHGLYEGVSDFELSNLGLLGTGGGASVSFRQGDWICPSDTCSFHNFSRNEQCMVCATAKPQSSSSRPVPRAELSTPTQQRLTSTSTAGNSNSTSAEAAGPASHLTPQQQQAIQTLAAVRNVAIPPHLAVRSTPPTYHTLPTRPLLNSVSLPNFQGVGGATAERARKLSAFSSPGFQLSPFPGQPPSGQVSPGGTFGSWLQDQTTTPSPDAYRSNTPGFAWPIEPPAPPAGLGLSGVRPRSGGPSIDTLARPGPNGASTANGHRATLSLGGAGHAPPQATGERFAPIVNSGNTGPMTIQQGDWACGTCGFVNWRRRRVCLKCFPFAEGNELAGGNLAASVLLVTQLAQAPSIPSPAATLEGLPGSPHTDASFQPAQGLPIPTGSRSFISSGPYQPPPASNFNPPYDDNRAERPVDFDVFGLASPVHSPPALTEPGFSSGPASIGGRSRKDSFAPLSPIGAEVRSLAGTYANGPPQRPTPTSKSAASLRDLARDWAEHERQLSEGMLGLSVRCQGGGGDGWRP